MPKGGARILFFEPLAFYEIVWHKRNQLFYYSYEQEKYRAFLTIVDGH